MSIAMKKYVGFTLGAAIALLIATPMLLGSAFDASAQALTKDQLFGNQDATGGAADAFAGDVGLGSQDLVGSIQKVIRVALSFLGIIAVVIILLGGFKWMTSGGETTKVGEAKKLIFAGIIGLIIVLFAYAIASFVITKIAGVTA